jgi:hypothetical protein
MLKKYPEQSEKRDELALTCRKMQPAYFSNYKRAICAALKKIDAGQLFY